MSSLARLHPIDEAQDERACLRRATLALAVARRQDWILAVLVTPVLVLLSSHGALHAPPLGYLVSALPAFLPVLAIAGLGQWLFWTLRSDPNRAVA